MTVPLPNEILVNIFQHLPLYSQRQCLQVCKTWNTVAHTFTDDGSQRVMLHNINDIERLFQQVSLDPARGACIRRMCFISKQRIIDHPFTAPNVFAALMKACPNLAELEFVNICPRHCIDLLRSDAVDLPKLEIIRFPGYQRSSSDHLPARYLMDLSHKYCETITQACIRINNYFTVANLQRFKILKCLSLEVYCPVELDALITVVCPQLQVLKLKVPYITNFQVVKGVSTNVINDVSQKAGASRLIPQLETLKIDQYLLTQDLFDYLKRHCPYLSQLDIFIGPDQDLNPLFYRTEFKD
ncbi:hypothetical protein MBANPS3_010770 [Mucor bainieri]